MSESRAIDEVPVRLKPYTTQWAARFARERAALAHALGPVADDVEHVGSTSVPGLMAKPTIDILLGSRDFPWRDSSDEALANIGYAFFLENDETWRVYIKPWRDEARGFHLHVVEVGSPHWRRHLLLRDYLRTHPAKAASYGRLKARLVVETKGEREAYQAGKQEFIERLMREADAWARNEVL